MCSLITYDAIKSYLDGKKTPYQLDLEVKDRKPSIIPKVGDRVKIKSLEWYKKWNRGPLHQRVDVPMGFYDMMKGFCGSIQTVNSVDGSAFTMKGDVFNWKFSLEMFEEVYPVQEQLSSKFPRIDLSCPLPLQSPYEVKGSELVLSKEQQERLKEQLREKWGVKPKLKQVKTTHLIKLKKL